MTLRVSPSWAYPRVSRIRSLTGVRRGLAGCSPAPPVCIRRLGVLHAPVVPRAPLVVNAGRRALSLLYGRLLDERLRLVVQVSRLGRRRSGHGP
jgi:hypothetical protein